MFNSHESLSNSRPTGTVFTICFFYILINSTFTPFCDFRPGRPTVAPPRPPTVKPPPPPTPIRNMETSAPSSSFMNHSTSNTSLGSQHNASSHSSASSPLQERGSPTSSAASNSAPPLPPHRNCPPPPPPTRQTSNVSWLFYLVQFSVHLRGPNCKFTFKKM